MSLAIDVSTVTHVLLADGWHDVIDSSFYLDSYEFQEPPAESQPDEPGFLLHGGGNSGICATGFVCRTSQGTIYGPLTSVFAVKVRSAE